MDAEHRSFTGRNGTLVVGPSGVTIKRSFAQALTAGHVTKPEIHIPYHHLEKVIHHRSGEHPGYLQFATKPGTPGHSGMHRSRIHFQEHHAHDFRRAKELIDDHIRQIQTSTTDTNQPSNPTTLNPLTGKPIEPQGRRLT